MDQRIVLEMHQPRLHVCGDNDYGQLGLSSTMDRDIFTVVPPLPDRKVAEEVILGCYHTMVLAKDGTVLGCGYNSKGQLGLNDDRWRGSFEVLPRLPGGKRAKQVIAGASHTIILAEDGTLFASGWNNCGQLGLGDTTDRYAFTAVPALPDGKAVRAVVAGYGHTMVLADDLSLYASGRNDYGQLGKGDTTNRLTFKRVPPLPDGKRISHVRTGANHTMILADDGTVFACGDNSERQLGLGASAEITPRFTFTAVPALPHGRVAKDVVPGGWHTMVLADDGTVFAVGRGGHGQLGLNDTTANCKSFTAVPPLPDNKVAKQVLVGSNHTMILAEDGSVFATGCNDDGRLGLGDITNRDAFTAVPFFGPDHPGLVPCVSGKGDHTFAVPAPPLESDDDELAVSVSPLQSDLLALVGGGSEYVMGGGALHLIGCDGVVVAAAHAALLQTRCPKLFQQRQRASTPSFSSPPSSPTSSSKSTTHFSKRMRLSPVCVVAANNNSSNSNGNSSNNNDDDDDDDDDDDGSITVSDVTGRALGGIVRFLYSDTLPDFDEMDEHQQSTTTTTTTTNSDELSYGLGAAFELMVAAQVLSSADAPAMQHLQALCERHIAKRLSLSNVIPLLAKAVGSQYAPLQRICLEYLAVMKPVSTDATFGPRLVALLGSDPDALGTAISAAGGILHPATPIYAPTEIPSQRLPDAMASLWHRCIDAAAARPPMSQENDNGTAVLGPDITVSIGSGDGATSLRADRFVLASRSDYFQACLDRGSFLEGAAGRVTLDVPAPLPSAAASKAVLKFLYTGTLSHESVDADSSSSSLLSASDALDVLHVTGHSDEGGGYLQLRDNEQLRSQARSLVAAGLDDDSVFSLLRRSSATNQQEAKGVILEHLLRKDCGARPTDGQAHDEDGAWAVREEWWSKDQEIAMCHELIDDLISSRHQ